ncbi:MAG: helix-turn-helix domain-containing protein [Georgfuchsia sp.]
MKSLTLDEAAAFVGLHPNTLQARAKAGEVPGAKVGKEWRFIDVDLVDYLRAKYPCNTPKGTECRSTNEAKRGGSTSRTAESGYAKALERTIGRKRSASTTNARQNSGLSLVPANKD